MQTIFEKCPFKENGKLLKLFFWFCRVLICQWGLIPHRTKSCEVSDPAEQDPAGYETLQNQVLRGIWPRRTVTEMCIFYSRCLFCGVRYPTEQPPAGSDTLPNKILRGIKPCGTKFCGVLHPGEQLYIWIFPWIWNRIKQYFRVWIQGLYGFDSWKQLEVENLVLLSL